MIKIIALIANNDVIGRDGQQPLEIPEDLRRFKCLTMGKVVVMGGMTARAINKPLPGRTNVVISRGDSSRYPGFTVLSNPPAVRAAYDDFWVIGGAEIYRLFLPIADQMHLSRWGDNVAGDVLFPSFSKEEWQLRATRIAKTPGLVFEYWQRVRSAINNHF